MKEKVNCSECSAEIMRLKWNYGKQRPITQFFCDTTCKGVWQRKQREVQGFTREWLASEYVDHGKSANDIAREIGRDPKRVWEWIRNYGIETRKRGSDERQQFKKGVALRAGCTLSDEHKEKVRQARIKDGRIPCMVNGVHWLHHYADRKPASWKGGISPERQAVYSSREWIDAVKAVWKRDNATCQRCGKHHNTAETRGTFHIHHIVSFAVKELRTDVSNLVLLCRDCHFFVHSAANTGGEFIKGNHQ